MTENKAHQTARRKSKEMDGLIYVVYEPDTDTHTGYKYGYHVATEYDMETFYLGATAVAAYESGWPI